MIRIEEYQSNEWLRNQLLQVLKEVDQEFLPPLSHRKPLEFWMTLFEKGTILYALEREKVAGFLAYYPSLTGEILKELKACVNLGPVISHPQTNSDYQGAYLHFIATSPPFRGNKISSLLMTTLLEDVQQKNVTRMRVVTWSTNNESLHLYTKHGFRIFHRAPNDRGEGVASVYLEVKLPFFPEVTRVNTKILEGLSS